MTLHVGFSGTRHGMTTWQISNLIHHLPEGAWFHHGDCIGADQHAHHAAVARHCKIVLHPPDDPSKRAFCQGFEVCNDPLPYLQRNRRIVFSVQWLIAAPLMDIEQLRSGTWATMRQARRYGVRVTHLLREGGSLEL